MSDKSTVQEWDTSKQQLPVDEFLKAVVREMLISDTNTVQLEGVMEDANNGEKYNMKFELVILSIDKE